MLRRTLTIGIVLVLLGLTVGVASAHYVAHEQRTHLSEHTCVSIRSEISHGSGGGYSKTTVRSKTSDPYTCDTKKLKYAGEIKARWRLLWKDWDGWATCRYSNYAYNTKRVDTFTVKRDHGSTTPCGDAKYITQSNGGVLAGSGGWKGTTNVYSSPGHWLPSE